MSDPFFLVCASEQHSTNTERYKAQEDADAVHCDIGKFCAACRDEKLCGFQTNGCDQKDSSDPPGSARKSDRTGKRYHCEDTYMSHKAHLALDRDTEGQGVGSQKEPRHDPRQTYQKRQTQRQMSCIHSIEHP